MTSGNPESALATARRPVLRHPRKVLYDQGSCGKHRTSGPELVPELILLILERTSEFPDVIYGK